MFYYQKHIFLCHNQKESGKKCCAQGHPDQMQDYLITRLKKLHQWGLGKVRVSSSGCLGFCKKGPTLVIYSKNHSPFWYTYANEADIEEILQRSILADDIVTRLSLIYTHAT